MRFRRSEGAHLLLGVGSVAGITAAYFLWLHVTDATIVALTYLLPVLLAAAFSRLWLALLVSALSALALNFYFLPPIGTLNIDEPQDWAAFFAFIAVSVVASHLSSVAQARTSSLRRLFEFTRDTLVEAEPSPMDALVVHLAERFGLDYAAVGLAGQRGLDWHEAGVLDAAARPRDDDWQHLANSDGEKASAFKVVAQDVYLFGTDRARPLWVMPLRRHSEAIGVLAVGHRRLEVATCQALASVVAISVERLRLIEQRQQEAVERRSVEIKSALLTSLGHDLRTPLTAVAAALNNLRAPSLTEAQYARQLEIALEGVDRLERQFQEIIEMARLDTGGITPSAVWVHPGELVQAARSQVEHALRAHAVDIVDRSCGQVARVDPHLTTTALAHVLENAAQYSPAATVVTVTHRIVSGGLNLLVEDHGPGIDPQELPHVFERFFRGVRAKRERSGTGMGLAIARGLISAQGGRVSAENRQTDGLRVSLFVPAEVRTSNDDHDDSVPA